MNKMYSDFIVEEQQKIKKQFSKRDFIFAKLTGDHQILLGKYLKYLRISEKYIYLMKEKRNIIKIVYILLFSLSRYKKNKIGNKLGVDIRENSLGRGAILYHPNIIINGNSKIGINCKFHGNNCIGNDGKSKGVPKIGNNVDIGYGVIIIGEIEVTDDVTLGAGTIVTKSILKKGTYVGSPIRRIGD